ncbi:MAG: site-specific integrase [Deltaproteobacteria bacterium]|nr:site-specific integrase [Deltaproteobacteria bacterium]
MEQKFERVEKHLYKRQYRTAGGDWSTLAKEELKVLEARNIRREDFDKDSTRGLTLYAWMERFFQVKASKRSLDKDKVSAERLKGFFGDCALDSITTSQTEAYKQKRLGETTRYGKHPKPATVNRELALLRSLLILAARDGLIDKVPYVQLFEEKNQRDRVASEDEFQALLEVSPEHLREILICLWNTGMRKREALNLTWDKVDMKSGFIHLDAEKTKTGEGRQIPISPRLKTVLSEIWQREKGGKVVKITERVFLFRGRPIDRFDRAFKTACQKAGVEGLWIHDLRASFATRKIAERFDRDWVKMITGHRTDHVFRRYNRPSIENLKAVVANDG